MTDGAVLQQPADPFLLPPATAGRFGLLMVATVTGTCYLYSWMAGNIGLLDQSNTYCAQRAEVVAPGILPDLLLDWYTSCARWASLWEAVVVAAGLAVLLVVAALIYLAAPSWERRGLVPLADLAGVRPQAVRDMRDAVTAAGVGTRLTLYVDHAHPQRSRAFGRFGDYSIVLGSNDFSGPARAAVFAHELGHIKNKDVDLTSMTIAVGWSFLLLAVIPAAVTTVITGDWWYFPARLAVLAGLTYVLRHLFIRTREFYADLRTVQSGISATAFLRALDTRGAEGGRFQARFHPSRERRAAILEDQRPLFAVDLATAAASGVLVGLAYRPAYYFISLAWPSSVFGKDILCGLIFGGLVAAILAGGTWRSTLWTLSGGHRTASWFVSSAFTVSLLVGDLFAPAFPGSTSWLRVAWSEPVPALIVALLLLAGCQVFLVWTSTGARGRLALHDRPRRAYHLGVAQAAVVAGVWLGFWFRLVEIVAIDASWQSLFFGLASSAFLPIPLIAVWWACVYVASSGARGGGRTMDRDLRAPLTMAYAVVAGTLLAYGVALYLDRAAIAAVIDASARMNSPAMFGYLAFLLCAPAMVVATAASLLMGACLAGRRRTGLLLCTLVGFLPALATGVMVVSLTCVVALDRTDRRLLTLISGLGLLPGADADDRPAYAALGLMIMSIFACLLVTCVPAAAVGNLLRRHMSPGPARVVPVISRTRTALLLLPVVAIAVAGAGLAVREWTVAVTTVDLRGDFNTLEVQRVADGARPGELERTAACARMVSGASSFPYSGDAATGAATHMARLAVLGLSADDSVMQKLGRGTLDALNRRELQTAGLGVANLLRYCGAR